MKRLVSQTVLSGTSTVGPPVMAVLGIAFVLSLATVVLADTGGSDQKPAADRTAAAVRIASEKRVAAKAAAEAYRAAAEKAATADALILINEPLVKSADKDVAARASEAIRTNYAVRIAKDTAKTAWAQAERAARAAEEEAAAAKAVEAAARGAQQKGASSR